jgi:hypothetical protein
MDDFELGEGVTSPAQGGQPEVPIPQRIFGRMRGEIRIAEDFDAPLPDDILEGFENSSVVSDA